MCLQVFIFLISLVSIGYLMNYLIKKKETKRQNWQLSSTPDFHAFYLLLSSAPPSADPAVMLRMLEGQELTRPSSSHTEQGQTKWSETHKSRQLLISPASFFDSPFLRSLSSCTSLFLLSLTLHCFAAFFLFCGLHLSFTFPSRSLFPLRLYSFPLLPSQHKSLECLHISRLEVSVAGYSELSPLF